MDRFLFFLSASGFCRYTFTANYPGCDARCTPRQPFFADGLSHFHSGNRHPAVNVANKLQSQRSFRETSPPRCAGKNQRGLIRSRRRAGTCFQLQPRETESLLFFQGIEIHRPGSHKCFTVRVDIFHSEALMRKLLKNLFDSGSYERS